MADPPRIPETRNAAVDPVAPRARTRRDGVGEAPREPVRRRPLFDPTDIEAAITRLTRLLAADGDGPPHGVPRGYYLNILV